STSERFSVLEPRDRDRLDALAKLDRFEAGQEILVNGRGDEWVYLIAEGKVEIRAAGGSGEVVLGQLGPGDLFGELEAFADLPAGTLRYVAVADTIVRAVNKHPLKQELKTHRSLASGLLAVYCRSISEKVRLANEVAVKVAPPPPGISRPPPPGGRAPHLTEEEAAWIGVLGQKLAAAEGETVVAEGETTRSFYVVENGEMEVRKRAADRPDLALARLSARDMFGFMAFVDGKPRSASVVAITQARLSKVDPEMLEKATHVNFTVSFKFLGTLCGVLGRTYRDTANAIRTAAS
ncbi:MAG: cyclic nucleotide-binding domain-containing protein, partial [Myxococcales bacterium]